MAATAPVGHLEGEVDVATLEEISQRVLWLATRMIDYANHDRRQGEIKVGGHQASCASMVGIMTALWFGHLDAQDKVAVKPHASPVLHAINYLTGRLERSYLERLRDFGGLQAYPSRTKDPDVDDFSTGSVGLGVAAPLFAAAARRYIDRHLEHSGGHPRGRAPRFIGLAGDAELDEGNVWEAITEPALQGLGNVMWVVDTNRQSLDRVVPDQKVKKLEELFAAAGWHVIEAKYGSRLRRAFDQEHGEALREHIDGMANEQYQSLFALAGAELRARFLLGASPTIRRLAAGYEDPALKELVCDLGGHDLASLLECFARCDDVEDRPSVVFAYTVKGWGLPIAGDPLNHAALLPRERVHELRCHLGLDERTEWDRFAPASSAGRLCAAVGARLARTPRTARPVYSIPTSVLDVVPRSSSTQEVFGRVLGRLADDPGTRERLVTVSPDVSVSTNLGGWINKVGVFHPDPKPDYLSEGRALRWKESPGGQHIELGISEMNLFLMLQALGLGHELHDHHLLPIGTVYDPFVCRGLDALVYSLYNDARFVLVGTPAGISLAPEGGAHQSSITPSIGTELPNLTYVEPCFARPVDWLLCDGLHRLSRPDGDSLYLRLSTRPVDQAPFEELLASRDDPERLRRDVIAGGYRLRGGGDRPAELILAATGAVVPEVLAAADLLHAEGLPAVVIDLTSPDRLYREWRNALRDASRQARTAAPTHHLARLIGPAERSLPIVTIHDAASHDLAWLGSVFGTRLLPVGVDEFGQSGSIPDLYRAFDLLPEHIVNAALVVTS